MSNVFDFGLAVVGALAVGIAGCAMVRWWADSTGRVVLEEKVHRGQRVAVAAFVVAIVALLAIELL